MPRRFSLTSPLAALLVVGLGLGLTGCLPSDPVVTPPPTSDAEPVFASDEEALAAAEEAYGNYISTASAILRDGGSQPERLEPLVSADIYERDAASFQQFASSGWHGVGQPTFEIALQQFDEVLVVTYVCDDFSDTDVLDGTGTSVAREGRQLRVAYEADFDVQDSMRLVRKELWEGEGVC